MAGFQPCQWLNIKALGRYNLNVENAQRKLYIDGCYKSLKSVNVDVSDNEAQLFREIFPHVTDNLSPVRSKVVQKKAKEGTVNELTY